MIDLLGRQGEKQGAQFFGQGEGHHEIRRANAFAQFALHPLGGGLFAALRAGPVVAGMEVELA